MIKNVPLEWNEKEIKEFLVDKDIQEASIQPKNDYIKEFPSLNIA